MKHRKQESWLSRLNRAVRWRLPPCEAEEILSDYRELLSEDSRSESELFRDFGSPEQAAQLLSSSREYFRWLAVLIVLALCLLLPVFRMMFSSYYFFRDSGIFYFIRFLPFLTGGLLSLHWFRQNHDNYYNHCDQASRPVPRKLRLFLLVLTAEAILAGLFLWQFNNYFMLNPEKIARISRIGQITGWVLTGTCILSAIVGILALYKARLSDRRWCALYLWALTISTIALYIFLILTSMSLEGPISTIWTNCFLHLIPVASLGLIGTGVLLSC